MIDNVTTQWTREMAFNGAKDNTQTAFPVFDIHQINALIPGISVWDSWFVMDENNQIADVDGFRVLIALGCAEEDDASPKLMYFFSYFDDDAYMSGGEMLLEPLVEPSEEWSGSTILRNDGLLQTFYTVTTGYERDGVWQSQQRFATAIQSATEENDFLYLTCPDYHDFVFVPEQSQGRYQTVEEADAYEKRHPHVHNDWANGNGQVDNFCFRDPKFFRDPHDGTAYLFFEANTGKSLWSNSDSGKVSRAYIGSPQFEPDYRPTPDALKANGCIGVITLDEEYKHAKEVAKPILAANLVADEIERANIIEHEGYYYLFFVCHGNKMAFDDPNMVNRDFMVGFRSEQPANGIRALMKQKLIPLNDNGVVLQQKSPGVRFSGQETNPQYVYSWIVMPDLSVVCYSNFSTTSEGKVIPVRSAGPTVQLEITGTKTRITGLNYNIRPAE